MARKGWHNLKPGYRKDLERGGITQYKYEHGADLKDARRHRNTPEHPLPKDKPVPKRFQRWWNKRYNNPIKMLTADGEVWLVSVSSRHRSLIGSHWNAIHSALFNIPMAKAWWWTPDYEARLAKFSRYRVRGIPFTSANVKLGDSETFHFMTNFNDAEVWTYEDTASFNNIYELIA
jgi:hypothetical protein